MAASLPALFDSPGSVPQELVARIQGNLSGFRIGVVITMFGFALMVPWAVGIAARLRFLEGEYPV